MDAKNENLSEEFNNQDAGFGPNFDWEKFEQTNKLQDKILHAVLTLTRELEIAESQDQTDLAKNLARKVNISSLRYQRYLFVLFKRMIKISTISICVMQKND
ncbi:hypothetical protein AAMO2058_000378500 [Amorphochlora amoebiformis]